MQIDEKVQITLVSVLGGFFLSSAKDMLLAAKERKKAYRIALLYFLQLWGQLIVLERRVKGPNLFRESLKKKYPGIKEAELQQGMDIGLQLLKEFLKTNANTPQDEAKFFQEAMNKVSIYDPILAFEISSSRKNMDFFQFLHNQEFGISLASNHSKEMLSRNSFDLYADSLTDFESDLKRIAWKSGFLHYFRMRSMIKSKKKQIINLAEDIEKDLMEKMDAFMKSFEP